MESRSHVVQPVKKALSRAALLLALAACFGSSAVAGHQSANSTTLSVSLDVMPTCVVQTTPLDFGSYDPLLSNSSAPLDAQAIITTVCTPNTWLLLELDDGLYPEGGTRRMSSGTDFLAYGIYKDPGFTQPWGRANTGLLFQTPPDSLAPVQSTVFGRVPAAQNVTPGDYQDSVEVRLHFD